MTVSPFSIIFGVYSFIKPVRSMTARRPPETEETGDFLFIWVGCRGRRVSGVPAYLSGLQGCCHGSYRRRGVRWP